MLSVSAMLNGCNAANYSLMLTLLSSLNPAHTGWKSQVVPDLCGSVQIVTPFGSGSSDHERCPPPPKLSNDVDGPL